MPALWGPREMQLQLRVWKGRGEETVSVGTGGGGSFKASTTSGKNAHEPCPHLPLAGLRVSSLLLEAKESRPRLGLPGEEPLWDIKTKEGEVGGGLAPPLTLEAEGSLGTTAGALQPGVLSL